MFTNQSAQATLNYSLNVPTTQGTIYFHSLAPFKSVATFLDSMKLDGGNYTDVIMSNFIAGAMIGHLLHQTYPALQFDRNYVYGTEFGQYLQENQSAFLYESSTDLLDPSPQQQGVMGVGQGGPYQINLFAANMVTGENGYALPNYVALQKNIGMTVAQINDFGLTTPPSFNNKYYGPMLMAFWHYNDVRAMHESAIINYDTFTTCMNNLANVPNSPFEVLMNYAYNQGYWGSLIAEADEECASNPTQFASTYGSYAGIQGSSYGNYPYQVRFYVDELYGRQKLSDATTADVHVAFDMPTLRYVFGQVFSTFAYINGQNQYVNIPTNSVLAAFDQALAQNSLASNAVLDLSSETQRPLIFNLLDSAINDLAANLNIDFTATSLSQIGVAPTPSPTPTPTTSPSPAPSPSASPTPSSYPAYTPGNSSYTGGTIVTGSDGKHYQCISNTVAPWCRSNSAYYYAPVTGAAWQQAWQLVQ